MQPVATTSGGAPTIQGDANMHSCNNQSINQSIIHSALQKIRSWVMSFVFFADDLKSWTFAAD